ncbi:MAG: signal peptidase II [Acidimicrobiia bacterium]|nr:signal peptidase II [Acidimicrobiia bacterium]
MPETDAEPVLSSRRALALGGGTAAVVVIVDRLTKLWALNALADGEIVPIEGILGFDLAFNTGAAYGLFKGGGSVIAVGALVAAGLIIYALRSVERRFEAVTLGAIMGGALGNLIDRIARGPGLFDGAVVDWIETPLWPNFNIADSAIVVGAVLLILATFRRS